MSSKNKSSDRDYLPPWCDPLPKAQNMFFMAVTYDRLAESNELAVKLIYLAGGDDVYRQLMNGKNTVIEVYVVSLSDPVFGELLMERVRKMTYGYVCDEQDNITSMAYRVITRNEKQYTFSDLGEIPTSKIHQEEVLFLAEWLWLYL